VPPKVTPPSLVVSVLVLVAAEHFLNPFRHGVDGATNFVFHGPLHRIPRQLRQTFSIAGFFEVEPVDGFCEPEICVDGGDDNRASMVSSSMPTMDTLT
jgi:hypothetical protein